MPFAFEDLDARSLRECRILLDVDGTLVADGASALADDVRLRLIALARTNAVFLHSNKQLDARLHAFARATGATPLIGAPRKPSRRIATLLPDDGRPLVVIGDKWMTDGWFARRVGARFIRVQRKTSTRDPLIVWCLYALDDVFAVCRDAIASARRH
ncbi:hypothetical protein HY635_01170 [Candidatus Uhrbacteria bacterium]|nr:hypothetical protein [Candidatus Uhrbacteria bacterium]